MPDDLHRTGRRQFALRGLAAVLVAALGCSRSVPPAPEATPDAGAVRGAAIQPGAARSAAIQPGAARSAAIQPGAARSAATQLLLGFGRDGEAAAERLDAVCDDRAAYLVLRRAAAASLSAWRRWTVPSAEVSFGPEIASQEAGGSIGPLDRAVQTGDCAGVRAAARSLGAAFRITDLALADTDIPPAAFGQALSDAAYRLGQAVLESTAFVPEADDTAFADVRGFLDFLDGGTRAAGIDVTLEAAPFETLRRAKALADIGHRAALVRATGMLGTSIRRTLRSSGIPTTLTYRPLRDAPDPSALTLPRPAMPTDPAEVAFGARLFFDRRLSRGGVRACAGCHVPERDYADGLVAPASLEPGAPLRRNTPTLLYAPLEALLTWDGRVRTADRQALMVLHTRGEMGMTDADLERTIGATPRAIADALAAYEASALVPGTAPIDRFARGDQAALTADASAGLDVFAGKGRCARCHVPPVFGGSRPPDFTAPVFGVLGVPSAPGAASVDGDRGSPGHAGSAGGGSAGGNGGGQGVGAFRVPTVRNVRGTAPYFHHGRYPTLEGVIDFYDRGGGKGLGLDVPNQDPEVRPLHLSPEERRVLLVFLRQALTDRR
jgi:cytochrome c peroxidase